MARRDLAALADAMPDLKSEGSGRTRRWRLGRRERLAVSFGERLSLHFGRQLMSFLAGTLLPEWLDELTDKLGDAAARGADEQAAHLARRLLYVTEPYRRYEAHDATVDALMKALLADREVTVAYAEGRELPRFRPYTLVVYRRALYLVGSNVGSTDLVTLAVDRIRGVTLSERTFRLPPGYRPDAALQDRYGIRRGRAAELVVLRFPEEKRRYLEARHWHPGATITTAPDGRVELRMFAGGQELVNLALEWGAACEVVEPAWLREEVVRELRAALVWYESGGGAR